MKSRIINIITASIIVIICGLCIYGILKNTAPIPEIKKVGLPVWNGGK